MTPDGLARTHAAAFPGKGWGTTDFDRYLSDPRVTVHGDETAFAVIRRIADEAEILTLATHPEAQGAGRATALLAAALDTERAAGATSVFLEVAEDNAAARALYDRAGFIQVAERKDYYKSANGLTTARILRKSL